ncbi:hypothetical protein ACIBEJ_50705 [Nonomuraea sp. NPDC050790]|uniref:hypothetical protein n=1 Tax=Nonomuraea sp. NPDC050790 TaxID=3364371 RepID=UPI0037B23AF7
MNMKRYVDEDLHGAEFRECDLTGARLIGVVMQDAVIDGLVTNLVVNGVEVTEYVEAELDRRNPVRLLIRSEDPADLREAARQLHAGWAATIERIRRTRGRVCGGAEHPDASGGWVDDGQDVPTPSTESDGLDEIAGQQCIGLGAQESAQVVDARSGAGSMPSFLRISQTADGATLMPSVTSSPCTRRYPQDGFSCTRRKTRARMERTVGGRPHRFGA